MNALLKYSLQLGRSQVKRYPALLHEEIAPSRPNLSFDELCKKDERFLAAEIARLFRDGRRDPFLNDVQLGSSESTSRVVTPPVAFPCRRRSTLNAPPSLREGLIWHIRSAR